jgi:hypothetical protein
VDSHRHPLVWGRGVLHRERSLQSDLVAFGFAADLLIEYIARLNTEKHGTDLRRIWPNQTWDQGCLLGRPLRIIKHRCDKRGVLPIESSQEEGVLAVHLLCSTQKGLSTCIWTERGIFTASGIRSEENGRTSKLRSHPTINTIKHGSR